MICTFLVIFILLIETIQLDAAATCVPGATKIFSWHYTNPDPSHNKSWSYSANGTTFINILTKVGHSPATPVEGTLFEDRVREDPESDAGMIIENIQYSDAGTFRVVVIISEWKNETKQEEIAVDDNAAYSELVRYAEIKVTSSGNTVVYNATTQTQLGRAPIHFEFILDRACIRSPAITIYFNNQAVSDCPSTFSCDYTFNSPGEAYVIVSTGKEFRFPENNQFYVISNDSISDAPCVHNSLSLIVLFVFVRCISGSIDVITS